MTNIKTLSKGLLSASALTVFSTGTAFAAGTAADTTVSNTFTLDYSVGTTPQPQVTNSGSPTTFKVDRLVDLTVAAIAPATTSAPGAVDEELRFTVTNNGNDTQAYALSVVQETGDDFQTANVTIVFYVDDGDGVFEPGGDDGSPITYNGTTTGAATGGDVPADRLLHVVVQSDIPSGATNGQTGDLTLVADTLVTGGSGTAVVADPDGNNDINATENVLADDSGTSNENANEGDHSATNTLTVGVANITGAKTVSVFSEDGSGCGTIPGTPATPAAEQHAIPGACVEYVITASNGGPADALAMTIADTLPAELEFVAADFSGFTGSPAFAPALPASGTDCASNGCVISLGTAELAGGTPGTPVEGTLTIRALIK